MAGGLNYCGDLGRRHRLELSMVAPELTTNRIVIVPSIPGGLDYGNPEIEV